MCLIPDGEADTWIPRELIASLAKMTHSGSVRLSQVVTWRSHYTCTDKCTFTYVPIACVRGLTRTWRSELASCAPAFSVPADWMQCASPPPYLPHVSRVYCTPKQPAENKPLPSHLLSSFLKMYFYFMLVNVLPAHGYQKENWSYRWP